MLVHIVTGTDRRFRGHNLRNEFLLVFQCLIKIRIKSSLGYILIDLHLLILVALTDDSTISLGHIRGTPAHIQVMKRHQAILAVCSGSHFLCTAHQHTNLTSTHLCKQFFFLCFRICIVNKCNFFLWHTGCYQLRLDVIIDIKRAIVFRGGEVTEQKLGQPVSLSFFPNPQHILHTGIELTFWIIRQQWID